MKLFLFSWLISCGVFAAEYRLAKIQSNVDKNITEFFYDETAEGGIHSLRFVVTKPGGQVQSDDSFPIETVQAEGITLVMSGRPVLKVFVEKFIPAEGGGIKLDYLYNGLSGTRRVQRLFIKKSAERFWLFNLEELKVNSFLVKGNYSPLFGLIGIREILYSWKEEMYEPFTL